MTLALIGLIGITLIVVRGSIFKRLQQWQPKLFRCAQCSGAWIGAAAGVIGVTQTGHGRAIDALITGGAISFLAMLADAILLWLLGDPDS